ncbi:RAD3-like DEAD/DEAH box helicase [Novosphingobium sp. PhB55]|nr:RAD3-like DEAD/DEAH box helicase [Novosphingobium sp. PhB55]
MNSVEGLGFLLTDYQRKLWEDLISDDDVITSAPTSAGKTFIILHYLVDRIAKSDGAFAAIVVPTRALISEVAGKIYELIESRGLSDKIEICTVPRDGEFNQKTLFVMTQERLHDVLLAGDITFNYFFLDEAHNISDKTRGVLLHMTIDKLLDGSTPQVIISMPSEKYQDTFSTIFDNVDFVKAITKTSPVAKLLISVEPKGRNLVLSRHDSTRKHFLPKNFTGASLADIAFRLGRGESNIIYQNGPYNCERMADSICDLISDEIDDDRLNEAADYIEKFIHDDYSLANNLRHGVAFHYGPLPSSVRVMIENLVKEDSIRFIACTSTLAEGVNLPAKNLFLKNPIQTHRGRPSTRIEDVKMRNITGRAGRMLEHFTGNIFIIEPSKWTFDDYFEEDFEEAEKIPSYYRAINEELPKILSALEGNYQFDEEDQYRFYTIANKLIKEYDNGRLEDTLGAPELTLGEQDLLTLNKSIKTANEKLKVAPFTLEASPTIGYIQQNFMYEFLNSVEIYDGWILPHPKSPKLYEILLQICRQLQLSGVYVPSEDYTLDYICMISCQWIQGKGLKEIISGQVEWDKQAAERNGKAPPSVNTSVRNVIKVINSDIGFRLSGALRCYDILLKNALVDKGIDRASVKLHSYLEIGACDERMISLINIGLSRESAREIHGALNEGVEIGSSRDVMRLLNSGALDDIHPVTKKELLRLLSRS